MPEDPTNLPAPPFSEQSKRRCMLPFKIGYIYIMLLSPEFDWAGYGPGIVKWAGFGRPGKRRLQPAAGADGLLFTVCGRC